MATGKKFAAKATGVRATPVVEAMPLSDLTATAVEADSIVDRAIAMQDEVAGSATNAVTLVIETVATTPQPPAVETAPSIARTTMIDTAANTFESATQPAVLMQENFRSMAEKGLEQARTQYDSMKKAAETATGKLETSMSTVSNGVIAFNLKVIEALRANANATFDHLAAMSNVKTISEAVELQSAHARKQFDTVGAQTKDITALVQKVASDASEPVKAAMAARA